MRLLFNGCRRGLRENDARNMHVYLGNGDAGHVLDCVLDRLLQRLRHLWNIRAIFQVDTDIDNGNIVVEADLNRPADASSFQQALNRRMVFASETTPSISSDAKFAMVARTSWEIFRLPVG